MNQHEKPILFSTPMVQAIIKGTKTQTRRIIKMPSWGVGWEYFETDSKKAQVSSRNGCVAEILCPYGSPASFLWIRETWRPALSETHECFAYKADGKYKCGKSAPLDNYYKPTWKPSIHMPRKACRLLLEVSEINVERLQDISEEDAIAEGVEQTHLYQGHPYYRDYLRGGGDLKPIESFASFWQSINGADFWNLNPWVWVVKFEKLLLKDNNCNSRVTIIV
jgi:hypothetical protein